LFKTNKDRLNKPSPPYPCEDCRDAIPRDYCDPCKARWEEEQQKELEIEEKARKWKNERQRARYKWHRDYHARHAKPALCETCGKRFKPKRSDAKHCSAACRQRAYVKRDGKASNSKRLGPEHIERAIKDAFTANPDSTFTTDELCKLVYLGLKRLERKHRAAVLPVAQKVCV
jgi:hypothetical protein